MCIVLILRNASAEQLRKSIMMFAHKAPAQWILSTKSEMSERVSTGSHQPPALSIVREGPRKDSVGIAYS